MPTAGSAEEQLGDDADEEGDGQQAPGLGTVHGGPRGRPVIGQIDAGHLGGRPSAVRRDVAPSEAMTDQTERYDRISAGYERWWAPVLRPSTAALLDLLAPSLAAPGAVALDVGAGTGNLTLAALARWPELRVTAVDVSSEMLVVLTGMAEERLSDGRARLETRSAPAAELPDDEATYDVAMASFVLQLVPNRARRSARSGASSGPAA